MKQIALLTIYQYRLLYNQMYDTYSYFFPTSLPNGSYFISAEEISAYQGVEFAWIKDLPLIDYTTEMPNTTPPDLMPYAVEIPQIYQWAFPEDLFILSGFEIPLDTIGSTKVVNLAYFNWVEFRAELDSGKYTDLKRALMPLWDYVAEQVTNNNIVVL
jgi:hypothetical protein